MAMVAAASGTDFGVAGVQPEPRAGYHDSQARERSLEAFSRAVWQRHDHGGHRPGPTHPRPTRSFPPNWPLLALDPCLPHPEIPPPPPTLPPPKRLPRLEDVARWSKPRTLQRPANRAGGLVAVGS